MNNVANLVRLLSLLLTITPPSFLEFEYSAKRTSPIVLLKAKVQCRTRPAPQPCIKNFSDPFGVFVLAERYASLPNPSRRCPLLVVVGSDPELRIDTDFGGGNGANNESVRSDVADNVETDHVVAGRVLWMFALFAREFPSSDSQQERRSTMDCWVRLSGRETVDFPAVAFIAAISEAVVQAALPVLPEFDRVRLEAVASPGVG